MEWSHAYNSPQLLSKDDAIVLLDGPDLHDDGDVYVTIGGDYEACLYGKPEDLETFALRLLDLARELKEVTS